MPAPSTTATTAGPGTTSPLSTPQPAPAADVIQTGCHSIEGLETEIQRAETQGGGTSGSVATHQGSDLANILSMSGVGGTDAHYRQIAVEAATVNSAFSAWTKGSNAAALNGALAALANDCVAAGQAIASH
ncbi:MAG: hypothetical protein ACLPVF_00900 [Acidimicrobiales bacterium]